MWRAAVRTRTWTRCWLASHSDLEIRLHGRAMKWRRHVVRSVRDWVCDHDRRVGDGSTLPAYPSALDRRRSYRAGGIRDFFGGQCDAASRSLVKQKTPSSDDGYRRGVAETRRSRPDYGFC